MVSTDFHDTQRFPNDGQFRKFSQKLTISGICDIGHAEDKFRFSLNLQITDYLTGAILNLRNPENYQAIWISIATCQRMA